LPKACITELLGVTFLVYTGGFAVNFNSLGAVDLLGVSLAHGLCLAFIIYVGGPVSGGHYNPAVTIPLMAVPDASGKRLNPALGGAMIGSQIAGSFLGAFLIYLLRPNNILDGQYGFPMVAMANEKVMKAFVFEFLATFFLSYAVVAGVKLGHNALTIGTWVGAILMLCINFMGKYTGASLNPCRTLGPAVFYGEFFQQTGWWIYYAATIVGGTCGGLFAGLFTHAEPNWSNKNSQEYQPALNTAKGADENL